MPLTQLSGVASTILSWRKIGMCSPIELNKPTIVAIVLVILLVFFALGFVFWAKRYNKCCFHQHQVVVVKKDAGGGADDVEVATRLTDQMDNGNKMSAPGEDEKPESDKKLDSGNE